MQSSKYPSFCLWKLAHSDCMGDIVPFCSSCAPARI